MASDDTDATIGYLTVHQFVRRGARAGVESVKPGTLRGAVPVLAWLATVIGLVLLGRAFAPSLGLLWLVLALAIMLPVAARWPERRRRQR